MWSFRPCLGQRSCGLCTENLLKKKWVGNSMDRNWSAHSPPSPLAATTHKFQASVCAIPIIPPCWWYQGRRGSQQGSQMRWLTLSADTESEMFSAHRDLIIHFPVCLHLQHVLHICDLFKQPNKTEQQPLQFKIGVFLPLQFLISFLHLILLLLCNS